MNIREEKPRWISTDTAGNVTAIYLDGSVILLLEAGSFPGSLFSACRIWIKMEFRNISLPMAMNSSIARQDGKRFFSYRVRDRISDLPDIYKFSASDIKIGITDRSRNRIYLINSDGITLRRISP